MSDDEKFEQLGNLIQQLYEISDSMNALFASENRKFTLDGHLLGSIGEVLAKYAFGLCLESPSNKSHDARAKNGKRVQVKLTAVESGIGLYGEPEALIVLHLADEGIKVVYNGPGLMVWKSCGKKQRNGQRHIGLRLLSNLDKTVMDGDRISMVRPFPKIHRRKNRA